MLRAFVTFYPWDLIDEGINAVLDRLHGDVGITGVSVWAASPPVTQLRVRDVTPRLFRTRGGLFFHPDEQHYSGTRCNPIVSGWVKGKRPLKKISDACADRGMELRIIISAGMTGRFAQRYSEMACKNAFGDVSYTGLCLANPDVQSYLCGVVADLSSNHSAAGVTITDFVIAWAEAFGPELLVASALSEMEASLLSTCFCESCHQRATAAGVDVGMARRSVTATLQRTFDDGPPSDMELETSLSDNAPLKDYHRWRTAELASLLQRLAQACKCELLLDQSLGVGRLCRHADLDLSLPAAVITRMENPEQLASAMRPAARRSELRLAATFAHGGHGPELVSILPKAAELGFAAVEFDNYGLLPESALTPIKQAIRFARRTTGNE